MSETYDAILLLSFGGPEGRDDVIPFLENVLRGKPVPRERMLEVAEHYYHFDGVSPINQQNRDLIAALEKELADAGIDLPIYWGNRNWHPLLPDTLKKMADDGKKRVLTIATSAFSSYSGCRQYRENIRDAIEQVGEGSPEVHKIRVFFNHPGFIEASVERVKDALGELPEGQRGTAQLLFTAHSIPEAMSATCDYEKQLQEASRLVAEGAGMPNYRLVYQSRSGPPTQPWLEPDVCDYIQQRVEAGDTSPLVIVPIGFLSDHMEVLFDLDIEAEELCKKLDVPMVRAKAVGCHPRFVRGLRELIQERLGDSDERVAIGMLEARPDFCPEGCCPAMKRPAGRPGAKSG